jgi:hypothetical protein
MNATTLLCDVGADSALLDTQTRYDLDLVASESNTLSSFFDKTITKRGSDELKEFLLNPTDDIDTLSARQQYLFFLLEHAELSTSLRDELKGLALHEPKKRVKDDLGEQALDRVYFSLPQLKKFNTNPYALDVAYGMHIVGMCAPLIEHIILHLGIEFLANASHDHHHDHHGHHVGCKHSHMPAHTSDLVYYGLQTLHWGLHLPSLYDMASDIKDRALMVKYVQAQAIRIAEYVRYAENIHCLLKDSKAQAETFAPFGQLEYFFGDKPACSESFQKLLSLLKKSTFQGDASVWCHIGNVLAAYKLYGNVQDEFDKLTQAVSQIDIYLSAAAFMQGQIPDKPWCFATFVLHKKPTLIIEDLRHLFVSDSKALDFSSEKSVRTLIIGDNGSGKSTYLMSIGHAIILAQTFGIVPAARCEITPFSHIYTFRFIHDNMVDGTSRFYAECARVGKIVDTIQQDAKHACVILDEPFSHTNASKGATYLKKSLADIGILNNAISLIATHYHDLDTARDEGWDMKELPARVCA